MDEQSVKLLENIAYAARSRSGAGCVIRAELHTAGLLIRADGPARGPTEPGAVMKGTYLVSWPELAQAPFPCVMVEGHMDRLRNEVVKLMAERSQ